MDVLCVVMGVCLAFSKNDILAICTLIFSISSIILSILVNYIKYKNGVPKDEWIGGFTFFIFFTALADAIIVLCV